MSVAEIQALDAGRGQRIPTFDEVLGGTELPLQVEIKDPGVLEPLTHVLAEVPAERERITLTTFDVVVAAQLRDLFDDVPVGLIVPEPTQDLLELALGMGLAGAFGRIENTSQEYIAMAQEAGLRVDVWPVNDPAAVQRALELGADGFTTDDPHVVERAGYSLRRKPAGSG